MDRRRDNDPGAGIPRTHRRIGRSPQGPAVHDCLDSADEGHDLLGV